MKSILQKALTLEADTSPGCWGKLHRKNATFKQLYLYWQYGYVFPLDWNFHKTKLGWVNEEQIISL